MIESAMETSTKELKFAADRMLGKLAKWLRIMGQDVIYGQHLSGYGLIHAARSEHRLILTRDRKLKRKAAAGFSFDRERRLPRTVAPGDSNLRSCPAGQGL